MDEQERKEVFDAAALYYKRENEKPGEPLTMPDLVQSVITTVSVQLRDAGGGDLTEYVWKRNAYNKVDIEPHPGSGFF